MLRSSWLPTASTTRHPEFGEGACRSGVDCVAGGVSTVEFDTNLGTLRLGVGDVCEGVIEPCGHGSNGIEQS